ncbi:MAG: hypothetical protein H6631_00865 [Anaerolineaceae bacterium]|nr:hypothetical protein [Anaerolineaceae bacterium]
MPTPILATKLYIPPLRPKVVRRPRLTGRDSHLRPAGFNSRTADSYDDTRTTPVVNVTADRYAIKGVYGTMITSARVE